MLSSEYEVFDDITDTVQQALADKKIRMECEARERYERDRISLYNSGQRKGFHEAIIKYILKAKENIQHSKSDVTSQIMEYFDLSEQEAITLINEHWE